MPIQTEVGKNEIFKTSLISNCKRSRGQVEGKLISQKSVRHDSYLNIKVGIEAMISGDANCGVVREFIKMVI